MNLSGKSTCISLQNVEKIQKSNYLKALESDQKQAENRGTFIHEKQQMQRARIIS